ncbi:MAG TPA: TIR domain-containing protein [Opitutaceae bacterium]|jgi:TolB-like protein/Flp pilus assembly protein TadD|nr:TIR domain-containing protein [Opitutaceae bacterium]
MLPGRAIFLSYASQDAEAAHRLCAALRAAGLEVWFDQNELRGGDAWDQKIRRQIRECSLFLPLISAATESRAEGYFRLEWHLAEQRSFLISNDQPFIVPVVIDGTAEPGTRVPERFRERQWIRMPGGAATAEFAARIAHLLGAGAPDRPASASLPAARPAAPAADKTVAVLPFINLSGDKENEYFSDGVSDELLTVLQKIPGLRVAARTSAFSFKATSATAQQIGQALGSAHLVEGSVQRAGARVKISARLSRSATGETIWSRSFTRDMTDVFAVQEEIAVAIVDELRGHLAGSASEATALVAEAVKGGTRNAQAYQEYLAGRHFLSLMGDDVVRQAIDRFRRATEIDPQFAQAWALLSQAHTWMAGYAGGTQETLSGHIREARAACERAFRLEPALVEGLIARYSLEYSFDFAWQNAAATIARALELAPNDPAVLIGASRIQVVLGDVAASERLAARAVEVDPLNAQSRVAHALALLHVRRPEEAQREMAEASRISPSMSFARSGIAMCLVIQGRYAEAEAQVRDAREHWSVLWVRHLALVGQEKREAAEAEMDKLIRAHAESAAIQIASCYAFAGDADRAFDWLERARRQRDPGLGAMLRTTLMRPLYGDPRWRGFCESIGMGVVTAPEAG